MIAVAYAHGKHRSRRRTAAQVIAGLRASRARLVAAAADERRRIERDLHDGAQQELLLLNARLALLERQIRTDPEAAAASAAALRETVAGVMERLRDLARGIHPAALDHDGLAGALTAAANRAAIPVRVRGDAGRWAPEVEVAVYFCCLEALQNAAKHGGPGVEAEVVLQRDGTSLHFVVEDTGGGVPANAGGSGLQHMRDRISAVGGELAIESVAGRGTRVSGRVKPVRP